MVKWDGRMWKRWPLLRILLCQVIGFFLAEYIECSSGTFGIISLFITIFLFLFRLLPISAQYRSSWMRGMMLMLMMISLGALNQKVKENKNNIQYSPTQVTIAKVEEQQRQNERSIRFKASLYYSNRFEKKWIGNAYLYVNASMKNKISSGDIVLTTAFPKKIRPNKNPGAFNFAAYAERQGIIYQLYFESDQDAVLLKKNTEIKKTALPRIKTSIMNALRVTLHDSTHLGLAEAMLIGHKEDLDGALLNAYIETGVVHIIAISGLHLGVIFFMINGCIILLFGKKYAQLASLFITLPIIWTFTILSGSSASVIRSALMFSMMIIGNLINRKNSSMNALLGSASVLLAINPNTIHDLGFQLSYAALLSILLFERRINDILFFKNNVLAYLWGMVTVTLSAQLLTTPFTIYYFHRFPLLFLFTNLVAVPISSLILVLEILMVLAYFLGINPNLISLILNKLFTFMNYYVTGMNSIPYTTLDNLRFSVADIIISFVLIISLINLITSPTKVRFYFMIVCTGALSLLYMIERIDLQRTNRIAVLDLPQQLCIARQLGKKGTLVVSTSLHHDTDRLKKILFETSMGWGVVDWKIKSVPDKPLMIAYPINDKVADHDIDEKYWILITGNPSLSLKEIHENYPLKGQIITDRTHPMWKIQQWGKEAQRLTLRFHSIAEKGTFSISLNKFSLKPH